VFFWGFFVCLQPITIKDTLLNVGVIDKNRSRSIMIKWEYKQVIVEPKGASFFNKTSEKEGQRREQMLNELGAEGWELGGLLGLGTGGSTQLGVQYYFKRPIE
jgi:hypothetical protein